MCQESFIRKYDLYDHVRTIHGAEPNTSEKTMYVNGVRNRFGVM